MATIHQYESQIASDTEINPKQLSGANIGAGIQDLGQGIQEGLKEVVQHEKRMQKTKVDTQLSKNNLDIETQMVSQTKSFDPTDPEARAAFMKPYDDANKKTLDSITNSEVREYAESKIANYAHTYWNLALHNNAKLQGKEYSAMLDQRITTDSQSTYLNPALLQMKIDGLEDLRTYHKGQIGDAVIDKSIQEVGRKLTESAIKGEIRDNPEKALENIQSDKYDLPGDKISQLENLANARIRANKNQARADTNRAKTIQTQTWAQNHRDYYNQLDEGKINFNDIENARSQELITPQQAANLEARLKRHIDDTQVDDAGMKRDAMKRLALPEGDKNKITDFETLTHEYGHGLSQNSLRTLSNSYLSPKGSGSDISQGMTNLSKLAEKTLIQPSTIPWGDRAGLSLWGNAIDDMHSTYESNIKNKTATAEEMFDPSNKKYLGNIILKYQRSRQDLSAQAAYILRGAASSNLDIGTQKIQPIGADPQKTPLPTNKTSPALSPREQQALDRLMSKIPGAK